MLKSKSELEKYLASKFIKLALNVDSVKEISDYANNEYKIPKGMISDFICMRIALSEANEFVLFILLDSIEKVTQVKTSVIDKYYTMSECQAYRKANYSVDRIKFPLIFKMIQVEDNQWVGKIDIKTLMKLRASQLITYNANTQRVMERVIKGDKEVYKISLNQTSVNEIAEEFEKREFIPNTMTFNIPLDSDCDFYYDSDSCEFVIKSLDHLDITDSYHRYIAACKVSDMNPEFNYSMELRITNWDEDKARKFIYQEDKRNRMRKVDRDSMNTNKSSNIVVTRLNESIRCNLKGMINRNDGLINFGELSDVVDYLYFKTNKAKEKDNIIIVKTVNELTNNFNLLTETDQRYLDYKWEYRTMLTVMCAFEMYKREELSMDSIVDTINKAVPLVEGSNSNKLKGKSIKKIVVTEVNNIIKSVIESEAKGAE